MKFRRNSLSSLSDNAQPRAVIVGPKLDVMEKAIDDLDIVIAKMVNFQRVPKT